MIIVLKAGAMDTQIDEVAARVRTLGYAPHMIRGEIRTVIGGVGDERGEEDLLSLENFECVESLQRILQPLKLASRDINAEATQVHGNRVANGDTQLGVMAGECSAEPRDSVLDVPAKGNA